MQINDPHEDKALGRWIDKTQNLAEGKDNYASNGLVKIQPWANFHMGADTGRKVLPKLIRLLLTCLKIKFQWIKYKKSEKLSIGNK